MATFGPILLPKVLTGHQWLRQSDPLVIFYVPMLFPLIIIAAGAGIMNKATSAWAAATG